MKIKILLSLITFFTFQLLTAQVDKTRHSFLIKGKVINTKASTWRFAETDFFENKTISVNIQKDGTFNQIVFVEGTQELHLHLNNDAITIFVQPNDTIELNWDELNFENTFSIKSPNFIRNNNFDLNLELYKKFRNDEQSLSNRLWEERNKEDIVKYNWINDQFNQQLKNVLGEGKNIDNSTNLFVNHIYFHYSRLLLNHRLLNNYSLKSDISILGKDSLSDLKKEYLPKNQRFRILNNATFYESPVYRDFLFDYIRNGDKLFSYAAIESSPIYISYTGDTLAFEAEYMKTKYYDKINDVSVISPAVNDYYQGLSQISITSVRDWFITKAIFLAFEQYSFEEVEGITTDFIPKCKTTVYKDTLISYYTYYKKFKPGNPAPDFTLIDENGKSVSLSNFKGKVVYLDFWGVTCGPCRYDIKNYVPKLHEKYHNKDIVFINICVDVNNELWKKTLAEIKLDGVNLLAEGWQNNQVCKDYNIKALPHYMLIDKFGKFANNNAPRPDGLIDNKENVIDKLLMEK
jgi:peroxiredoxin